MKQASKFAFAFILSSFILSLNVAAQNLPAYQNWINAHTKEYSELSRFQKNRVFRMGAGQYYH